MLLGPEHGKFLFAETDKRLSIREAYPFFFHMFGKGTYFLAEPEEYRRQRDILLPQFSGKHVAGQVKLMERKVSRFISGLPAEGQFDLVEAFGPLITDITASAFLGEEVGTKFGSFFREFRVFSEGMDPLVPGWVPAPHLVRSRRARNRLRKVCKQLLVDRRRSPLAEPDFLQTLCTATYADDGLPVPDDVLANMMLLLVWVGLETTIGHLSWAMIDLLQHPVHLKRVREELKALTAIDAKSLRGMTHLDRALHETERLHPATNGVVRRATEPISYNEHTIPKGAIVLLHPGVSHRLPDVFSEPDTFNPDRFATEPEQALFGFGGGFHRCIGVQFAHLEMKVAITLLLRHLDIELIDTEPKPETGQKNNSPQSPCRVMYRRRSG